MRCRRDWLSPAPRTAVEVPSGRLSSLMRNGFDCPGGAILPVDTLHATGRRGNALLAGDMSTECDVPAIVDPGIAGVVENAASRRRIAGRCHHVDPPVPIR